MEHTNLIRGKNMLYVISYDIESDRIRNKIAKTLEGYGKRVQYSVFECELDKKFYDELYERLAKLMENEDGGNIRIYTICNNCREKIVTIGVKKQEESKPEDGIYII